MKMFYYDLFSLMSQVLSERKKLKIKGFLDSVVLFHVRFDYLNLPEMLKELDLEGYEKHFLDPLIKFTTCLTFYKGSKPPLVIINILFAFQ